MSDSDSSEDMPLSALAKKKDESSEEEEFNELVDSDEDAGGEEPDSEEDFIVEDSEEEDEDEDYASEEDSDDDAPLSKLSPKTKAAPAKKKAKAAKKSSTKKKAAPKKKATTTKKKKATTKKSSKSTSASSGGNYLCPSSELYSRCDKGKLIQSLLARWWYAYQWPDPAKLPATTPKGYDALDGFPGMYICTEGSDVGKFLDKRSKEDAPSFNNFAKKGSEELRDMLLRAIEKQMKALIKHEGEGTDTEKNLKALQKWANKLNCTKADKEAEKVLKAAKLKLP